MQVRITLVLVCLLLCTAVAAVCGPVSGSWSMFVRTDMTGADWSPVLDSTLDIDARLAPWDLNASSHFRDTELDLLQLRLDGVVGALQIYSLLELLPSQTPPLQIAAGSAHLRLSGMDLYALGTLSQYTLIPGASPGVGVGLMVGGSTRAGGVEIHVQSEFNMWRSLFLVAREGFATFVHGLASRPQCDEYGFSVAWWPSTYQDFFLPIESTCALRLSSVEVLVEAHFGCAELTAIAAWLDLPFHGAPTFLADFIVENIPTGLPWLWIDPIILSFAPHEKNLDTFFDLRFGEFACITPYFSYEPHALGAGAALSALKLTAITVDCNITPGVSLRGGHRFSDLNPGYDLYEIPVGAFTAWGDFAYLRYSGDTGGRVWNADYDEYYALLIDGDACCEGRFNAWFYVWFDTTQSGVLFDVAEAVLGADIDITPHATIGFHIGARPGEIHFMDFGFEFYW